MVVVYFFFLLALAYFEKVIVDKIWECWKDGH